VSSIAYTDHCLHYLLPEKLNRSMNLRHRGHEYAWYIVYVLLSVYFTLVIKDELTFT